MIIETNVLKETKDSDFTTEAADSYNGCRSTPLVNIVEEAQKGNAGSESRIWFFLVTPQHTSLRNAEDHATTHEQRCPAFGTRR